MIWFSFPLDFVSQAVQDFNYSHGHGSSDSVGFSLIWIFLVFRISCHCLTVQRLKGFKNLHNLFDKRIDFFDFWKFRGGNIH